MSAPTLPVVNGLLHYTCPRCSRDVAERLYGPCGPCRSELNARFHKEPAAVKAPLAPPEPKMHVVPNFVATKDDLAGPDDE